MEPGRRFFDRGDVASQGVFSAFPFLSWLRRLEVLLHSKLPPPCAKGSDINQACTGTSNEESQSKPFLLRRPSPVFIIVMEESLSHPDDEALSQTWFTWFFQELIWPSTCFILKSGRFVIPCCPLLSLVSHIFSCILYQTSIINSVFSEF